MKINWFKLNTSHFINKIALILEFGDFSRLSTFYNYLKIGKNCRDCGYNYYNCECNNCKQCKFYSYCLCNLNISKKDKENIKIIINNILFLVYYICSKNIINKIITDFNYNTSLYTDIKFKRILKLRIEKLEELIKS